MASASEPRRTLGLLKSVEVGGTEPVGLSHSVRLGRLLAVLHLGSGLQHGCVQLLVQGRD